MAAEEQQQIGPGGVPKGSQTSEFYRTFNIPERFENPEWFNGYQQKQIHPLYRPTSKDYGGNPPNVHTMPTHFNGRSQKFTNHLGVCGMPRNRSLNTNKDLSKV